MDNEIVEVEQNTEAWRLLRCGKITASAIHQVLAKPRKKGETESASRRNYKAQLVCERLTGVPQEIEFENWHTRRGKALEPEARIEYELRSVDAGEIRTVAFVDHPTIPMYGCSPDATIGDDGLLQIKCPIPAIHLDYLKLAKSRQMPSDYYPQVQAELSVTGRKYTDFVSYCKPLPENLQMVIVRVPRDDKYILELEAAVVFFNSEIDEMIANLKEGSRSH